MDPWPTWKATIGSTGSTATGGVVAPPLIAPPIGTSARVAPVAVSTTLAPDDEPRTSARRSEDTASAEPDVTPLTRAARIEPRTPEGEVYVTDAFAALLSLEPAAPFATEYVGRVTTAKEFETIPMYQLQRR